MMIATECITVATAGIVVNTLSMALLALWWTPHRSWRRWMQALHGSSAGMAAVGDKSVGGAEVQGEIMLGLDDHFDGYRRTMPTW